MQEHRKERTAPLIIVACINEIELGQESYLILKIFRKGFPQESVISSSLQRSLAFLGVHCLQCIASSVTQASLA